MTERNQSNGGEESSSRSGMEQGDSPRQEIKYCYNCGERVEPADRYCSFCGENLQGQSQRGRNRSRWDKNQSDSRLRALFASVSLSIGSLFFLGLGGFLVLVVGVAFGISDNLSLFLTLIGGYIVGFIGVPIIYFRFREFSKDEIRSYLRIDRPAPRDIGIVVISNVTILTVLILAVWGAETLSLIEGGEGPTDATEDLGLGVYAGLALLMVAIVGPTEELLYRGIIQNRLSEQFSLTSSVVITSLIFAVVHIQIYIFGGGIPGIFLGFFIIFTASLVFGTAYEYTENLVVPALVHGLHNSLLVTIVFFGPSFIADLVTLSPVG